jgi:uncharacterized membrane protein YgdD (TMEM256/DUF423 family)
MTAKNTLTIAAILLITGVAIGALGAHSLAPKITESQLASYHTAALYHFLHALGMLAVGILMLLRPSRQLRIAAWLMLVGICLFSGSIYLLACRDLLGITNYRWLGPITPIGGVCFMAAWGMVAVAARKM